MRCAGTAKPAGAPVMPPACANEWRAGVCEKPRVACRNCHHRDLLPLTDTAIYGHLAGEHTLGLYPLLENDHCFLLAVDFDAQDWRDDARAFLKSCRELDVPAALEISRSGDGAHPLDLSFIDAEDLATPWKTATTPPKLTVALPTALRLTLADRLYVERAGLPQALLNRLVRLAAFANPAFYKAQAMRHSVWNTPRVIGCAESFPQHIALPRGCLEAVQTLLKEQDIQVDLVDERHNGSALDLAFTGQLRPDQEAAVASVVAKADPAAVLISP